MKCKTQCCDGRHARLPHLFGPGFSRREFFRVSGSALTGYYFTRVLRPIDILAQSKAATEGSARNCIFVFLGGGPSHVDTFDFKQTESTPKDFQPETYGGITIPRRLFPTISDRLDRITIVRSAMAKAAVHQLSTVWAQIGRNPTGPLGSISPHIGAVVALEADTRRKKTDVLPGFVALNAGGIPGSGYLSARFAPFSVTPSQGGLSSLNHPDGMARFNERYALLEQIDGPLRVNSPLGKKAEDLDDYTEAAVTLMKSAEVATAFRFTAAERTRYGSNGFADACIVTRNLLRANRGTRFIAITLGGWDQHSGIYAPNAGIYATSRTLDTGLGSLMADLGAAASPETPGKSLLDESLIVVQGEFGRTVGKVTGQGGRDHFTRQFVLFAGASVRPYGVVGQTDAMGDKAVHYGWNAYRDVRNEDIVATIYSALGIDWTTVRYDDPIGRGFEYVPGAGSGQYEPVREVFTSAPPPRRRRVI
ncbi:MAG: DUF1501 domain-containing protein [Acidobacteria bacterium]|nr:DUF1501 domain-containing protein [Acidobacteriota bacterium]